MIWLVMGPPRGGKSVFAERCVPANCSDVTYVGTLPNTPANAPTILHHRERRPKIWTLLELGGDPVRDLARITYALGLSRYVLLDGLALYTLRVLAESEGSLGRVERAAAAFIARARACEAVVIVVDLPCPTNYASAVVSQVVRFHAALNKAAFRRFTIDEGRSVEVSGLEMARYLSRPLRKSRRREEAD